MLPPLDNSTITSFRECPRKAFFRYVRHWRMDGPEPVYFTFGSAWHAGLDALYKAFYEARSAHGKTNPEWNRLRQSDEFAKALTEVASQAFEQVWTDAGWPLIPDPDQYADFKARTPAKGREMFFYYYKELAEHLNRWTLIQTEQPFCVPLDTDDPEIFYSGRIDKVIEDELGTMWLVEHKTSTLFSKTTGFRNDFVQSFSPNSQVEGYMYAVRFLQSQGDLPDQPFGGVYVDASLVHKTSFYYKRIPVYYDDILVAQWLDDVRYWHKSFQSSRSDSEFPRATNNCFNKYSQCSYLHLCRTQPSMKYWAETYDPPEGFVADEWKPYDTKEIETN